MGKIRDWMHGSGRKTVIAVVTVIAAAIAVSYTHLTLPTICSV